MESQTPFPTQFLVYPVPNYRPYLSHVIIIANNFLTVKVLKKYDPLLVTLLKMPETGTSSSACLVSQVVKMRPDSTAHP